MGSLSYPGVVVWGFGGQCQLPIPTADRFDARWVSVAQLGQHCIRAFDPGQFPDLLVVEALSMVTEYTYDALARGLSAWRWG